MLEDNMIIYEDDNHFLNIEKQIGKGSFAKVYKGHYNILKDADKKIIMKKQVVAIKIIDSSLLNNNKNKKQHQILMNNLEIEITILKKLIHRNIVKLITTTIDNNTKQFIIVMEFCNLGDLSMLIRVNKNIKHYNNGSSSFINFENLLRDFPKNKYNGLNHVLIYSFIKQLASALKFIRSKNLIHRDIKPQNLLLSSGQAHNPPTLKVADFGFARFLPSQSMAETLCGSPQWMAPEILSYKKYDEKVDLWSSGAVIYEMCFGKPAYSARNYMELLKKIKTIPLSFPEADNRFLKNDKDDNSDSEEDYSDTSDEDMESVHGNKLNVDEYEIINKDMRNFIKRLLTYDPEKRMSFDEFFKDPIVTINLEKLTKPDVVKEITYHDVFYDDSDEIEEELDDEEDDKMTSLYKKSHSESFREADGYLMIDNEAIKTASEYPINERKKSLPSSRRSSFAGMTRAISKAFRSASQSSATSSPTKDLAATIGDKLHIEDSNLKHKKGFEQVALSASQFYDLTHTMPIRLGKEKHENVEPLKENFELEREKAKLHVLRKILTQEESSEWRLQLEIRLLNHITKLINEFTPFNSDSYIKNTFNALVQSAEEDYHKMKLETQNSSSTEETKNLNSENRKYSIDSDKVSLESNESNKENDLLWPDEIIIEFLWKHVSKFGRISLQLEKSGQVGAACMGYASILWLLDFMVFDVNETSLNDYKEKLLRMAILTIGRLKGVY
ncbi:hypothetical protein QEN19_003135 [Hanseniaspora menglaensis]